MSYSQNISKEDSVQIEKIKREYVQDVKPIQNRLANLDTLRIKLQGILEYKQSEAQQKIDAIIKKYQAKQKDKGDKE